MVFATFTFLLYADPGAGALIVQMLMAAVFGAMFFFRGIRDRVIGIFRKGPSASESSGASKSTDSETD